MLVLDTDENCSFNLVHKSRELELPMAHDIAIEDRVAVINCIIALSCIFHTRTSSHSAGEDELEKFVQHSSTEPEEADDGQR